jgi:hypothetical protein
VIHVSAKLTKNVDFVYLISQPITIAIYESDKCNKERSIIGDIRKMNKKNLDFFFFFISSLIGDIRKMNKKNIDFFFISSLSLLQ